MSCSGRKYVFTVSVSNQGSGDHERQVPGPNRTFSDNHRENKSAFFSVPISLHRISLKYKLYFWLLRRDSNTVVLATDIVIGSFGCSLRVTP